MSSKFKVQSSKLLGRRFSTEELLFQVESRLREAGIEEAAREARLLIETFLPLGSCGPCGVGTGPVEAAEAEPLLEAVARRETREPLQHILGTWDFRAITLCCDRRAMIPRPETEGLVDRALKLLDGKKGASALDVGTGSGCVALALAAERPDLWIVATDISREAPALARENAARVQHDQRRPPSAVRRKSHFLQADLLTAFPQIR